MAVPSAPSAPSETSPLEPVDLRCEYLRDPLGIDAARPRLSWALRGGARGERQSAYRVVVATTVEKALAGTGDLWDSGEVPDQTGDPSSTATHVRIDESRSSRAWCPSPK